MKSKILKEIEKQNIRKPSKYGVDGLSDDVVEKILSGEPYMAVLTPKQKIQLTKVKL
jgi:hypothetical protein